MIQGLHPLDAVVAEARKNPQALEATFNVPVLLVVADDPALDGATAVTGPGGPSPASASSRGPTTWIAPVQPRFATSAPTKIAFGRSSVCDVVLPFSPVSKHHGYFEQANGVWYVVDVGSTNGTLVDGRKAEHRGLPLRDGSTLALGRVTARFFGPQAFQAVLRQRLAAQSPGR